MKNKNFLALLSLIFLTLTRLQSFALPAPGDEHWSSQFGPAGTIETVYALSFSGQKLFAGGTFGSAGNVKVNDIAVCDGTNWSALNNGVGVFGDGGVVFSILPSGNNLYVGGYFTNADNCGAKNVARWDGTNWSAAMSLPNGPVQVLKFIGTNLYAAGAFADSTGTNYYGLARWTGSSWSFIPGFLSGGNIFPGVICIETDGTNIYIGGNFSGVAGISSPNVARWDGASWFAVGAGVGGSNVKSIVNALVYQGNKLYAGGSFTNASSFTNLATWNGSSWSVWANANNSVKDLVSDGTNIYVGGSFTNIGGAGFSCVAKWDGVNWSSLGTGAQLVSSSGVVVTPGINRLAFGASGRLYVGGNFAQIGGVGVSCVAGWDGTNWFSLGGKKANGLTHSIGNAKSFFTDGTNLYAGGIFTEAGDTVVSGIAKWNGTNWSALGSGLKGNLTSSTTPPTISSIVKFGTKIYAAGNFTNAGGVLAKGVACWDGASWSSVGSGFNSNVAALVVHKGVLFAGGIFSARGDGSGSLKGIAQFDGSDWQDVPTISTYRVNNSFNALASDGTNLFVGGNFLVEWDQPVFPYNVISATNAAYWDGNYFYQLGTTAPNNTVNSLAVTNGIVYAGGSFTAAGGVTANRFAQWNGTSWSQIGGGLTGSTASAQVSAILIRSNNFYLAGTFTNAGGLLAVGLAKWDGANWSTLGSGLTSFPGTPTAAALACMNNDLYVGGSFGWAGDKPAQNIARWNDQTNFYPTPNPRLVNSLSNTNRQFQFRVAGTSGERYVISASTNLTTWTPVLTNTAPLFDFVDVNATNFPSRSYRAVVNPQ